jgi:hypothetical protein
METASAEKLFQISTMWRLADNTIASPAACKFLDDSSGTGRLKIIEFNAERGRYWPEFATMVKSSVGLQQPDVILLNEMDVGMARSENVHTARKLAFELGMNYAWALEFVELTNGDQEEQHRTHNIENSLGLHGIAILSTCKLFDSHIVRDPLDPVYFSNKKVTANAMGYEKRLGGRMGLFARTGKSIDVEDLHLVVGSVHKVDAMQHQRELSEYFSNYNATMGIVVAGDIDRKFCPQAGLVNLDMPQKLMTWPAKNFHRLQRSASW